MYPDLSKIFQLHYVASLALIETLIVTLQRFFSREINEFASEQNTKFETNKSEVSFYNLMTLIFNWTSNLHHDQLNIYSHQPNSRKRIPVNGQTRGKESQSMAKLEEKNPSQWANSRTRILVNGQTQGREY